jgi:hypothetical protein
MLASPPIISSVGGHLHVLECGHLSGTTNTDIVVSGWASRHPMERQLRIVMGDCHLRTEVACVLHDRYSEFTARTSACSFPDATCDQAAHSVLIRLELLDSSSYLVDDIVIGTFTWTDRHMSYAYPIPMYPEQLLPLDFDAHSLYSSTLDDFVSSSIATSPALTASPTELIGQPMDDMYYQSPAMASSSPSSTTSLPMSPHTSQPLSPITSLSSSLPSPSSSPPLAYPISPVHGRYVRFLRPLGAVVEGWSPAERKAGRRLVQFVVKLGRDHNRTVLTRIIPPSSHIPAASMGSVVSCVAGARGDFLITSVDILRLATLLYGSQPKTAEKNRLRRHLERFGPRTIGRQKDVGGLYTRIATYDEPSPLTISKDIKVFKWTRLEAVMEAIIVKRITYASKIPPSRL